MTAVTDIQIRPHGTHLIKRNRIEIDNRLLNKALGADYEAIRTEKIDRYSGKCGPFDEWLKERAHRTASEYKEDALEKHFKHHSGNCSVCYKPLELIVYPLDRRFTSERRGRKTINIVQLPACALHTEELKYYYYRLVKCITCDCTFRTSNRVKHCSLACRSFSDYHNRKKQTALANCKHCAKQFAQKRADSVFCSVHCRVSNWRNLPREKNDNTNREF